MKTFANVGELASAMSIPHEQLRETFVQHGEYASGKLPDPFGKSEYTPRIAHTVVMHTLAHTSYSPSEHFRNSTFDVDKNVYVALMTPVVHYVRAAPFFASI